MDQRFGMLVSSMAIRHWWFVVSQQAVGGLIVALVIRYADNILKGYATLLSIIVSAVVSVYLFDFSLTILFMVGTGLTVSTVFLYGWMPRVEEKAKTNEAHLQGKNAKKEEGCRSLTRYVIINVPQ